MFNPIPKRIQEEKHKCKIKIKKSADGSLIKEISGNCNKEELETLSSQE